MREETFCVLPFIHAATLTDGSVPLCCVAEGATSVNLNHGTLSDYWSSAELTEVRRKMRRGESVKACRRCYQEEASGYRSHRVIENGAWEQKMGQAWLQALKSSEHADLDERLPLLSLDLRLGNTCNLQCVMCQPRESSKWKSAAESLSHYLQTKELRKDWNYKRDIRSERYEWYRNQNFWENLRDFLPEIREVIIGGGEPMLIKEHLRFIQECAKSGEASHIHLRYHTNMTIFPEEMTPYWEMFERVEFFSSIDGMDEVGHYVRYPARWDQVVGNLHKLDRLPENVWMRLLYSVNALNIHHIPQFLRWVNQQGFRKQKAFQTLQSFVHPGIVHWPDYLSVQVLPKDYKAWVTDLIGELRQEFSSQDFDKYEGIVQFMNSRDESARLPHLYDYVQALDKSRGTDFYQVFPELSEALLCETGVSP